MIDITPEQQIRDMIARTGLTPQEFATAYNNLTPGEIKLSRRVLDLERQLEVARKALELAKECIEANRHNALRMTETMTFCGDCGQNAPHCAEDSQFPGAGDACSIKHSEGCAMALQWRTSDAVDAALRSLSEPAAPHPDTERLPDELLKLRRALIVIERVTGDEFCEDLELTMVNETGGKLKEASEKLGRVYMAAHAYTSDTCFHAHDAWRQDVEREAAAIDAARAEKEN